MVRIFLLVFLLTTCLATIGLAQKKKEIYAHYMGCFPVATAAAYHHKNVDVGKLRHDVKGFYSGVGGRTRNWYLAPQGFKLNQEESAELEIKRAMRIGLDGFAIDAWAGRSHAKNSLNALFKVAEEKKLPFKITICLDPNCVPKDKANPGSKVVPFANAIKYLLDKHGQSPNLARRDGKPLIFGYHSYAILRTPEFKKLPEGKAKWDAIAAAFKKIEEIVGEPLFFHFCLGSFAENNYAAEQAGKIFPAVGAFLDANFKNKTSEIAVKVKEGGAEWAQPLWFQYNNIRGSLRVQNGTDILRDRWQKARDLNATLIQFVTWNDYGEDTILAPGNNTAYTIFDLNKYFISWWKNGTPPKFDHDKIYLTYRRYDKDAAGKVYPFNSRRFVRGVLEVATILTAPGKIRLPDRDITYDAPAGLYIKQFPLKIGSVQAQLYRAGKEVLSLQAPEPVTDKPFREDNSMVCFSTEFARNWKLDFGDMEPFYYSEYGDVDKDGLPNWFEMYWFGKFRDFSTAAIAEANADPDDDGKTNMQEYLAQSNPTKAERPYKVGDLWDMATIYKHNSSFNPDPDFNDNKVWYYLYKHGYRGKTLRDGNYNLCPHSAPKTHYTGYLAHLSPSKTKGPYKHIHGWISRMKADDGHWQLEFKPRNNALLILGWKSPVNAIISLTGKIKTVNGNDGITLEIAKGTKELYKKALAFGESSVIDLSDVRVMKDDFIYFISDCTPGYDSSKLVVDSLKIKLKQLFSEENK